MDITPQLSETAPLILRYGGGGFVIGGERVEASVCVHASGYQRIDSLNLAALEPLLTFEPQPELVLFGMGGAPSPLDAELRRILDEKQIGYDVMDTGAACRTFNILLSEERRVAALLIAI